MPTIDIDKMRWEKPSEKTLSASLYEELGEELGALFKRDVTTTPLATTATPAKPKAEDLPKDSKIEHAGNKFVRPNGETYVPRAVKVGETSTRDVDIIKTAYNNRVPVLLYGPPGTGKTALVDAVFEDLVTVQGSGETEVADFIGGWTQNTDGTFTWVDGPLVIAMEEGRPLLVDEIALIDPRTMAVVYGVMDGRGELVITANPARGTVKAADGFYIIGACNPNVPGAVMSDALLSRFTMHIEVVIDWSLLSDLAIPTKAIQVARNLHHKYVNGELVAAPQVRELIAFRDINDLFGTDIALSNLISQSRPEDRDLVVEAIQSVYGSAIKNLTIGNK